MMPQATLERPPLAQTRLLAEPAPRLAPIVPVSEPDNDAPTAIHPGALRDDGAPLPAWDIDPEGTKQRGPEWQAPIGAQQSAYGPPPNWAGQKKSSKLPLVLGTVFGLGLLGALAGGAALYYFKPWEQAPAPAATPKTTAAAAAATEAPQPVATSTVACTTNGAGKRIAPKAVLNVPVSVAAVPGGSLVAVGYADSPTNATGLTVDAQSLNFQQPFSRASTAPVEVVIPITGGSQPSFEIVHQVGTLTQRRAVDGKQKFSIGLGPDGFSRVVTATDKPELLWPDTAGEKISDPRVVSVADGHIVTFRRGSEIRVGWLTPDGRKKTGLATVNAGGSRVGVPTVAASDAGVLVTFAARANEASPWGVRLAIAKPGAVPTTSTGFELPSGGPGGEAISPTATALSGGRWLLQWTEGKPGARRVRAQTLGAKLEPLGEPMTLSPKGVEAGQGAIVDQGPNALATYLVKNATGYELWASSLSCP